MSAEVYSGAKPAVPWRSMLLALGLLLGASALAWSMVQLRSGVRLTSPVRGDGSRASFGLPVGFELRGSGTFERWQMAHFSGPVDRGQTADLFTWERPVEPGISAETLAEAVLAMTAVLMGHEIERLAPPSRDTAPLVGTNRGAEIWSATAGVVARAAVDGETGYAVSMSTSAVDVGDAAYARFDACCRSLVSTSGSTSGGD